MLEQKRAAQERLVIAARERKHRTAIGRYSGGKWQVYLVSMLFMATLFGVRSSDISNPSRIITEIALVMMYYGWLAFWIWVNEA
jgi:hypothetical protein